MFFRLYFSFLLTIALINFSHGQECFSGSHPGLCIANEDAVICSGFLVGNLCNSSSVRTSYLNRSRSNVQLTCCVEVFCSTKVNGKEVDGICILSGDPRCESHGNSGSCAESSISCLLLH